MYSNIKHVRVHIYIYDYFCIYINIYEYDYVYIYMYDYIYIYLHTTYMSQVPGTPQPAQWYGAPPRNLQYAHYLSTASHLYTICSISEPQPRESLDPVQLYISNISI